MVSTIDPTYNTTVLYWGRTVPLLFYFTGAPNARAQELTDATLSAIFKYLSMMMFEKHYTLLQFLFTMEHMKMTRKASNKELSILVNGFDKKGLDEATLLEHRPPFLENQVKIGSLLNYIFLN